MDLNKTILGQMITFGIFVWFSMRFVWPALMAVMDERQKRIADGLAAAEKGSSSLENAKIEIHKQMQEANLRSAEILASAHHGASEIIEEAKVDAVKEKGRIIANANEQVAQSVLTAKQALQKQVALLAIDGARAVLEREISEADHGGLLTGLEGKLQ